MGDPRPYCLCGVSPCESRCQQSITQRLRLLDTFGRRTGSTGTRTTHFKHSRITVRTHIGQTTTAYGVDCASRLTDVVSEFQQLWRLSTVMVAETGVQSSQGRASEPRAPNRCDYLSNWRMQLGCIGAACISRWHCASTCGRSQRRTSEHRHRTCLRRQWREQLELPISECRMSRTPKLDNKKLGGLA